METPIQKLIDRMDLEQKGITSDTEYAKGYKGSLIDCIILAKKLLEYEKQQIIWSHVKGQLWNKSNYNLTVSGDYFEETFELPTK